MMVAASVLGSATTLLATSGVEKVRDIYIQSGNDAQKQEQVKDEGIGNNTTAATSTHLSSSLAPALAGREAHNAASNNSNSSKGRASHRPWARVRA